MSINQISQLDLNDMARRIKMDEIGVQAVGGVKEKNRVNVSAVTQEEIDEYRESLNVPYEVDGVKYKYSQIDGEEPFLQSFVPPNRDLLTDLERNEIPKYKHNIVLAIESNENLLVELQQEINKVDDEINKTIDQNKWVQLQQNKRRLENSYEQVVDTLNLLQEQFSVLEDLENKNSQKLLENQAEYKRVEKENRETIEAFKERLNEMNRGAFQMKQFPNETEEEYLNRIQEIARTPFDDERLQYESQMKNLRQLKKNLKEIIKKDDVIENVIKGLTENERFQANKIFGLIKTKFLEIVGKDNPSYTVQDYVNFIKDVLHYSKFGKQRQFEQIKGEDDIPIQQKYVKELEKLHPNPREYQESNFYEFEEEPTYDEYEGTPTYVREYESTKMKKPHNIVELTKNRFNDYYGKDLENYRLTLITEKNDLIEVIDEMSQLIEEKELRGENTTELNLSRIEAITQYQIIDAELEKLDQMKAESIKPSSLLSTRQIQESTKPFEPQNVGFLQISNGDNCLILQKGDRTIYIRLVDVGIYTKVVYSTQNKEGSFQVISNIEKLIQFFQKNGFDLYEFLQQIGIKTDRLSDINKLLERKYKLVPQEVKRKLNIEGQKVDGWGINTNPVIPKGLVKFGRIKLNLEKLYFHNILSVKQGIGMNIVGFPNVTVSDYFVHLIVKILNNQGVSNSDFKGLLPSEVDLYNHLIYISGFHRQFPHSSEKNIEKLKKRIQLIEGEIESGNNNKKTFKELYDCYMKLATFKVISHSQVKKHLAQIKKDFF